MQPQQKLAFELDISIYSQLAYEQWAPKPRQPPYYTASNWCRGAKQAY